MRPTKYRKNTDDFGSIKEVFDDMIYSPKWFGIDNNSIFTVLDIGGLIGAYTLWAFENYPKAKIFTYEPHPESFELLLQNIKTLNNQTRIHAYNLAVWNKNGSIELRHSEKKTGGSSIIHKTNWIPNNELKYSINVEVTSINDVLKKMEDSVDILKMDCEGSEYDIINSIDIGKLKSIKHIVMEYHNPDLGSSKITDLIKYLRNNGFLVQKVVDNEWSGHLYAKQIGINSSIINNLIDELQEVEGEKYSLLKNRKSVKIALKLAQMFSSIKSQK